MMKFRSLRLYAQLILIVATVGLAVILIITVTIKYYVDDFNQRLTDDLSLEISNSINTSLLADGVRIENIIQAHTGWTELVEATTTKDSAWIAENATQYLLEDPSFSIDTLYLVNNQNAYSELYGVIPETLYKSIIEKADQTTLLNSTQTFLVAYQHQVFVISIAGLTDSKRTDLYGIYALGHRIDDAISKTVDAFYASKSDFDLTFIKSTTPIVTHLDSTALDRVSDQFYTLRTTNNVLAKSINNHANRLLYFIIGVLAISMLFLLSILTRLTSNFEESIKRIQRITYHDYSQNIDLNFSKDFSELSQCINNLSSQLRIRDQEINQKYLEMISILIKTLEEVDLYTKGHSERVSHYSVALATAIGYPDLEAIRLSGLLHDIGKITVPVKILNNPGKLTAIEFEEIKKHPTTAYNILGVSAIFDSVKDIVRSHHEKMDGSGYPHNLHGESIPLGARIVAIADVFDSLTSERSYRKEIPLDEALTIIKAGSGTHFDQVLVDAFMLIAIDTYHHWSSLTKAPDVEELLLILD